tara:strand:- start:106 stop:1002 length:897 start_codon:yes stop_codon:yes gene_type:complete
MSVYKPFKRENYSVTPLEVNHKVTLYSSSLGVSHQHFQSGSQTNIETPDASGSMWQSLRFNFYLSGSNLAMSQNTGFRGPNKFSNRAFSLAQHETIPDFYLNKFNDEGIVFSIPQEYFGLQIKRGSFKYTELSNPGLPTIVDDGYGNLYSNNAILSASSESAISSSDNYIGNIFYNIGVVTLTDTGSWKAGNTYPKFAHGKYKMEFESSDIIYQKDYSITINTNDFNISNNPSSRTLDGDNRPSEKPLSTITGSGWSPYMTTIGFYDRDYKLVMVARYPQPIKLKKDTNLTFKIRQDW